MADFTIQNLDDEVLARLRELAASHQCSVEDAAHAILGRAVGKHVRVEHNGPKNLMEFTRECFGHLGGVELKIPPRGRYA